MKANRSHVATSFQQRLDSPPEVSFAELQQLSAEVGSADLAAILQLHQMHRWKQGHPIQVEEYLEQIPRLRQDESSDALLDLIYSELILLHERRQRPELADFLRRFPHLEQRIRNLYEIHDAFANDGSPGGSTDPTIAQSEWDTDRPSRAPQEVSQDSFRSLPPIPGYEPIALLGRGGMGIVFKARQLDLDRIVAVKMIRAGAFATEVDVARFRREAHLVANLHHPNIVAVHDFGELQGHPYFTMEFVDGVPLSVFAVRESIDARRAVRFVRALAAAMAYAHSQGVVHRDIKPSNVIVDRRDQLKLLDFGLSFHRDSGRDLTSSGAVLGTPAYMACEQARGEIATPLSDIYSLGAVLFELLAGRPPFVGDTAIATLQASLSTDPPSLRSINPRIPRDLETLVSKCLSKDPADRIVSAQELTDELDRYLRDEPIRARPLSIPARGVRWCRRNRAVAALAALVLLTLIGGTVTSLFYALQSQERADREILAAEREKQAARLADRKSHEAETARQLAQQNELRALASEAVAKQETMTARRSLYASQIMLAQYAAETGNLQRARSLLHRDWVAPQDPDLRGLEWFLLWQSLHTQRLVFAGHIDTVRRVEYFPDGNRIASAGPGPDVFVHDVHTGMPLRRFRTPDQDQQSLLSISHDGKYLISGIGRILVWDAESGELVRTLGTREQIGEAIIAQCCAMHPSNYLLVTGHGTDNGTAGDSEAKLWNIETGELVRRFGERSTSQNWVYGIGFSPDGKLIGSGGADRLVKVWDVETGELKRTLEGHSGHVNGVAFTTDGKVVSGSWDNTIRVWDVKSGECEQVLRGHQGIIRDVDLAPDGRTLVSAGGTDKLVILWDLQTGQLIRTLPGHPSMVWRARFSPDGKTIVSCGNGLRHGSDPSSTGVAGVIKTWDAVRGESIHPTMSWSAVGPHNRLRGGCLIVGQHYDARTDTVWTAFDDGHIEGLDGQTQEPRIQTDIRDASPIAIALHPARDLIAVYLSDRTVRLYDGVNLEELQRIEVPENDLHETFRMAFHPSESALVIGSFWPTRVWHYADNRLTNDSKFAGGVCPSFSPDGRVLATGHNHELILWDWKAQRRLGSLDGVHESRIQQISFSRDGQRCATAASDGLIVLWQTEPLKPLHIFEGHVASTTDVIFSPDESRLISSGKDGTIRIWSIPLGAELLTVRGFGHEVQSVTFDAKGKHLFVAVRLFLGANNTVAQTRLFRLPSDEECATAVLEPPPVFEMQSHEERIARALVSWRRGASRAAGDPTRDEHLANALQLLESATPTEADLANIEAWKERLRSELRSRVPQQ